MADVVDYENTRLLGVHKVNRPNARMFTGLCGGIAMQTGPKISQTVCTGETDLVSRMAKERCQNKFPISGQLFWRQPTIF